MKPKKHQAEQFPLPIEQPVKLCLTITLTGDTARRWRSYANRHAALQPSNGQMAVALISEGLKLSEAAV